ncbi:MAG: glutathione S-transferase family protein [Rhodospirillales bacterium]|nr:glutathione S-transferase family protein [Rhodospirillales bacterium]
MSRYTLVIGNKNWSSWSLRPWLAMKQAHLAFDEVLVPLRRPDSGERLRALSPSGKVPVLKLHELVVWDSLAILEFLAERHPEAHLWPADPQARAIARSAAAEMHSGFQALRQNLPMDIAARLQKPIPPDAQGDIRRIQDLWAACRNRFGSGGPFLFGAFSIADAMYAPVVTRFVTYGVAMDGIAHAYAEAIGSLPAMKEWDEEAKAEVAQGISPSG